MGDELIFPKSSASLSLMTTYRFSAGSISLDSTFKYSTFCPTFLSSFPITDRHQQQWSIIALCTKNNSTHPLLKCCHLRTRCFGMDFLCRRFSCRQLPRLRLIGCRRQLPRQRLIGCLQLLNRRPKMTSMTIAERLDLINLQHIQNILKNSLYSEK
jgi:hypothetical protein